MNYESVDVTAAEEKEVAGLIVRNRDIYDHGAEVLAKQRVKEELQDRRQAFVSAHGLSCFKCGATAAEWAAGSGRGRLWVICVNCVRKPRKEK